MELYWRAYSELSTCRPSSFGDLLPIPWTAINDYAKRHQFDEDQFEWLVHICRDMDRAMYTYNKSQKD